MKSLRTVAFFAAAFVLLVLPVAVWAIDTGTALLTNVTPVNGGCVSGPNGRTVEAWDIQPGFTYILTISNVTECANGGTDPTLNMRINSSQPGYEYTDLVAVYVSPGVYQLTFTLPGHAWCTLPIYYCTTPGVYTSGILVRRHDGGTNPQGDPYMAHLRASSWGPGCTNPIPILGPECGALGTEDSNWGAVKAIYR